MSEKGVRMDHLHAHDAYCLLRHSFALPELLYTLRTSPSFKSNLLGDFDSLLRTLLGKIANISISNDDPAWAQASLPVNSGGLGIRSATQLAPSAFLASAVCCAKVTQQLLPSELRKAPYQAWEDALRVWREGINYQFHLQLMTLGRRPGTPPK